MKNLPGDWNQNKELLTPVEHEEVVCKEHVKIVRGSELGITLGIIVFLIVLAGLANVDENSGLAILIIGTAPITSFVFLHLYLALTGKKVDWSSKGNNSEGVNRGDVNDPSGLDASSIWTTSDD